METRNNKLDDLLTRATSGDYIAQNDLGNLYYNGDENIKPDYTEAANWYRKSAANGYLNAQFNLAQCYHTGEGVVQSDKNALEWMIKAADQDDIDALRAVGVWLYQGSEEFEPDIKKAMRYLHRASQKGDIECTIIYAYQCIKDQNIEEGLNILENLFLNNAEIEPSVYYTAGLACLTFDDPTKSQKGFEYLKNAAENEHYGAKSKLWELHFEYNHDVGLDKEILDNYLLDSANNNDPDGIYYAISKDIKGYRKGKTGEEIINLLELSANNGNADAALLLGKTLNNLKRKHEAIPWFRIAADDNNAEALYELAMTSLEVLSSLSQDDVDKSLLLLNKSHELGHLHATKFLGQYYEKNKDFEKARYYHEICANNNDNSSIFFMFNYEEKKGNVEKAIEWCEKIQLKPKDKILVNKTLMNLYKRIKNYDKFYEHAKICAENGVVEAMVEVAKMKLKGLGQPQDYKGAIQWLEKANTNSEALYMLGEIYENGTGVEPDYEKAVLYYQKSGQLGNTDARISLNKFKKNMFGKWKKK